MSFEKRRTLMKASIESQFNYCALIWMFRSRTMNNKINRIHERSLRLVYSDYSSNLMNYSGGMDRSHFTTATSKR